MVPPLTAALVERDGKIVWRGDFECVTTAAIATWLAE